MLVRSTMVEGHSHVWNLPSKKPAERAVFWSEPAHLDDTHHHALIYGGDRGPGSLQSETSGSDQTTLWDEQSNSSQTMQRGDVNPEQPDVNRIHSHIVSVLL